MNALAHAVMGLALMGKRQMDEAIASYKKAIELDPKNVLFYNVLGHVLAGKGQLDEAIACYRKTIALDPKSVGAHELLGDVLARKGQVDEAIACWRKAAELAPMNAAALSNLGATLTGKGQWDEAILYLKKAIALDPKNAGVLSNLGGALAGKSQWDEAIPYLKKAIALDPKNAGAHNNLGGVLASKGQLDEAIACIQKALALDPNNAAARSSLARVGRLAAARDKLAAFQNGSYVPAGNAERLDLAEWCWIKKLYHTATRLYVGAFTADPKLADDLSGAHRYIAASSAALAAAGEGEDAAKLDDKEKARLRRQALDWLRADLVLLGKQLETGRSADRAAVQRALQDEHHDRNLAGLRDAAALARLPAEERAAWKKLWADVAALQKKAERPTEKEGAR
jgi:tetratricopeptide (TPR) repeat protein